MTNVIRIHKVPHELRRRLEVRAYLAGQSLSDYLLREIGRIAAQPTLEELLTRLSALPPVALTVDPAEILRKERQER